MPFLLPTSAKDSNWTSYILQQTPEERDGHNRGPNDDETASESVVTCDE